MKKRYIKYALLGFTILFLYVHFLVLDVALLGWLLGGAYIYLVGEYWQTIFQRLFDVQKDIFGIVLSWFVVFLLLGLLSSVFIVFYTLTQTLIWIIFLLVALCSIFLCVRVKKKSKKVITKNTLINEQEHASTFTLFRSYHGSLILYLIVWVVTLFYLYQSRTGEVLSSPWQTIHPYVLPLFFFLTLLLGSFMFSKFKVKVVLIFVILHSLLLHAYLPLIHPTPWGGDVWRHIGVEKQLSAGELVLPVLFGQDAQWREVLGADIPEVFIIPNKYTYGHLWGSTVLIEKTLSSDLTDINVRLLPLLWSIVLPILLLRIGKLLFGSWRKGLWLSWLTFLMFPFQALGALTLPVSLGYLTFFFTLMLWLYYLQDGKLWQRRIALLFATLMLFGYALHFILIWIVIGSTFLLRKIAYIKRQMTQIAVTTTVLFSSFFIFPLIEILARISYVPISWSPLMQIKQLLGQFSGFYYASAIRSHDILSGNLFFNHTPDYAHIISLFTEWRWHVLLVVVLLWFWAFVGFIKTARESDLNIRVMQLLSFSVIGGYIIGWFLLKGDRLFIRRLDAMVAFLVVVFFIYGITAMSKALSSMSKRKRQIGLVLVLFALSWFGTTAFASGPDTRVASVWEVGAASYIADHLDPQKDSYCVLADTWVLLALEGLTGQRVVGGGFPIDYQFGQPERVVLLGEMIKDPRESVLTVAHQKTGADRCWVVIPETALSEEKIDIIRNTLGLRGIQTGGIYVWNEALKDTPLDDRL